MKSVFILFSVFSAAMAADLSGFVAGVGVEAGLQAFLTTYFPFSEDPAATTTWTDWWDPEGTITYRGKNFTGAAERLALKQQLLPTSGVLTWNHIVSDVTVSAETATSKTYSESVIVEITNTTSKQCGGYQGKVIAQIKKDSSGAVNLELHGGNYLTYVLDLPTAPNAQCT